LEGGTNHLLRPLMTGQSVPARAVRSGRHEDTTDCSDPSRATEHSGERTTCPRAGPLCTSLDRVGTAELPALEPGDLLVFGQAGAYGFTQAMTNFLSHPVPEQHWLSVGQR